jgi:myosin heavy subunit
VETGLFAQAELSAADQPIVKDFADLLKIDREGAAELFTTRTIVVRGDSTFIPLKPDEATDNVRAMAKALYSQ